MADPPIRLGPRPLALHLSLAMATELGGLASLPMLRAGWPETSSPTSEDAGEAALIAAIRQSDPGALTAAVAGEAQARIGEMLAGIRAYWDHPWQRRDVARSLAWQDGVTKLIDYAIPETPASAPCALFVPSLVNRGYVLDLLPGEGLLSWLGANGVRPLLLEWGTPGDAEAEFGLDDYILGRLLPAFDALAAAHGRPVHLVGYCMGGDLILPIAQRRAEAIASLAFLATPWDFHAGRGDLANGLFGPDALEPVIAAFDGLPVDLLQAFFASLDPTLALGKFRRLSRMDPNSARARDFVALEDWLNDGVPLSAGVARAALGDWYGRNLPAKRAWRIGGRIVRPREIARPSLVALPSQDRIVPPGSAAALADELSDAQIIRPAAGHIGMVVGGRAREGLWRPLREWLLAREADA